MSAGRPKAGARFLDLELPDHNGSLCRLSELAAGDPTIPHFYRGRPLSRAMSFNQDTIAERPVDLSAPDCSKRRVASMAMRQVGDQAGRSG